MAGDFEGDAVVNQKIWITKSCSVDSAPITIFGSSGLWHCCFNTVQHTFLWCRCCAACHLGSSDWTSARLQPETWIDHYHDFSMVALSSLHLNWTAGKVKDIKGRLPWVGAVNEVLGDSAYDISSSARNMTLLNDALNKCIEQAGCMARWCDGLTSHVPHASRDVCQALADRKEADLEELENRDYEK